MRPLVTNSTFQWECTLAFNKTIPNYCLLSVCVFGVIAGCNYSFNNYKPTPSSTISLSLADLVIETPTTAEVDGTVFRLKIASTANYGCIYDNSGDPNTPLTGIDPLDSDPITNTALRTAMTVTTPSIMSVRTVKMRVIKNSGPTGLISIDLNTASAGVPTTTNLTTSNSVDLSPLTTSAEGNLATFTLATPQSLASGASVALILKPSAGSTLNGINNFGLLGTDDAGGIACSTFSVYKRSADSGTSWINSNNAGHRRGYFSLTADVHGAAGSGYWIAEATKSITWDLTTFDTTEAPNSMGGTITYDVGVSETNTPVFTESGLSKSQLQALTDFKGKYLFIRVNLSIPAPYYERAEITAASIATVAQ